MSFKEAVKSVMKGGKGKYSKDAASAIVAEASRNASPAAKKANPKLAKVKGKSKAKPSGKSAPKGKSKAAPKKKAKK